MFLPLFSQYRCIQKSSACHMYDTQRYYATLATQEAALGIAPLCPSIRLLRPNDVSRSDFILPRTVIAARRRSGAPSKVCQWLGPMCRHKVTLKHFANRPPPNFYRGSKSAEFGLDSQNQSPLTGSSFETEQHIGNLKHVSEA